MIKVIADSIANKDSGLLFCSLQAFVYVYGREMVKENGGV